MANHEENRKSAAQTITVQDAFNDMQEGATRKQVSQSIKLTQEELNFVVTAKDIILKPFVYSVEEDPEFNIEEHSELTEEKKFKLNAFLSTPKFVKALTDVSTYLSLQKEMSK